MNDTPTSGPISTSITHHDRDAIRSRHSLRTSQPNALGERKHDLFESGRRGASCAGNLRELVERAFAAGTAAADQHEAIADADGVADLMDRQEQRAPRGGVVAERR